MLAKSVILMVMLCCSVLLTACGGNENAGKEAKLDPNSPEGKGQQTFRTYCAACHDVEGGRSIVGPSLKGIAKRAETRIEGLTAVEYLEESIINPNSYVVEGFPEGTMPQSFGRDLTSEQIDNLVAYLLTLK